MTFIGIQSLITIISHITFILITFWALQGLRTDSLIKKYHIQQAKILYIFLSIAIGYTVSSFFILSSQNLVQLFG
ncbi:DUF1146 family protein [Marinilactibacillus psychrotolerans]|uniref:DUF1146 family protein n=1 Tax=Marinilactibacillus psychrotolerans TaxID=191770 RepID=UPI001C7CB580|nr:DUF1146 family protein [Marinilactibacillus psychrotolerans]